MKFQEFVFKTTSICNLDCSYCYVFNQGDTSFKKDPPIISLDLVKISLQKINDYCISKEIDNIVIIFHGGEPLLAGKDFYTEFINLANTLLPHIEKYYNLQTNGTLLDKIWIEFLKNLNIHFGISLDGTEKATRNRIYRNNRLPAYNEIIRGIELVERPGILTVINIEEAPEILYAHYKSLKIASLDLLIPESTYEKRDIAIGKVGKWLSEMFEIWYKDNDKNKPRIRIFDIISSLFLGLDRGNEGLGRKFNRIVAIKTDGAIEVIDSLKICGDGFVKTGLNIVNNKFEDVAEHPLMKTFYYSHQDEVLCDKCQLCIAKEVCGGFHLATRYSTSNGFANPSVYCDDLIELFICIQNKIFTDLKDLKNIEVELLTIEDFA
ncbi:uncharacterized protein CLV62_101270 [Dysgonomonas alginatilytica]|uniref:Radical SAM core domain-containing protein n=1 Tax=Dysgonomonas alginatilytica TaxID=1605892 RepID=A0A2V3PTQ1_9BACT|nr:radical SAM protein [Dysgonomonas alginatilytica]PXV69003.1 uncharacterized protein CLV62_101270 [Dysgonomonas alginatilytica]